MTEIPTPRVPSIDLLLEAYAGAIEPETLARLRTELNTRDNLIADHLRAAAMAHGAMPALTTEVLCVIGVGDQPDDPTRELIHVQYHATIAELNRILGEI